MRTGVHKSSRHKLGEAFVKAYEAQCLQRFSPIEFLASLGEGINTVAFMCVERNPEACHRYLIAERFKGIGAEVKHILP